MGRALRILHPLRTCVRVVIYVHDSEIKVTFDRVFRSVLLDR